MGELTAVARLEVGQQVEVPVVEGPVAAKPTQRHDAVGVLAAAARARGDVGRVDAVAGAADEAGTAGDPPTLGSGGRRERAAVRPGGGANKLEPGERRPSLWGTGRRSVSASPR